jgi:aspartate/methionine/tyrosine aminotransferase
MEASLAMTATRRDLSLDQPKEPVPAAVASGAAGALADGETHYVETGGVAPLVTRLQTMLAEAAPGAPAPAVLVTAGVQEARFLAIQVLGEKLGGIALPAVCDPGVRRAAAIRALTVTTLPATVDDGFLPTPAVVAEALAAGARLIYLESPSRFTGAAYDEKATQEIADLVAAHDATVIWDQGLAPWVHRQPYPSIAALPAMADRSLVLGEAWPGVGLEAWFVGYLAGSAATIAAITTYKQIVSICTSTAAQYAAVAAAEIYPEHHRRQIEALAESYESGLDRARSLGLPVVDGATATLLAIAVPDAPGALARLTAAGINVADGAEYGAPGLLRLAATTDDAMIGAIEHLAGANSSHTGGA